MGRYAIEDPAICFCYQIKNLTEMKQIALTSYDWYYSNSDSDLDTYKEDIKNDMISIMAMRDEDDSNLANLVSEYNIFNNLGNLLPFEFYYLFESYESELYLCPQYDDYRVTLHNLEFGMDILEIVDIYTMDLYKDPNLSKFIKFLNDAKLNHIKEEFRWAFIYSD